jgi:hypothetical protein
MIPRLQDPFGAAGMGNTQRDQVEESDRLSELAYMRAREGRAVVDAVFARRLSDGSPMEHRSQSKGRESLTDQLYKDANARRSRLERLKRTADEAWFQEHVQNKWQMTRVSRELLHTKRKGTR